MTSRRRTREILKSFTSLEVYEAADPWMRGDHGRQFVAVDLRCKDCQRRLMRAKMSTSGQLSKPEPTWAKGVPAATVNVPELGLVAVFVCAPCSRESGSIRRALVPLGNLEAQLRGMAEPGVRRVVTRDI